MEKLSDIHSILQDYLENYLPKHSPSLLIIVNKAIDKLILAIYVASKLAILQQTKPSDQTDKKGHI